MEETYPKLVLPECFDARVEDEMWRKGCLSGAVVVGEDGHTYPVYIMDPIRLRQDLETLVEHGTPCLAEPGLIVVPEVTVEAIERALAFLWKDGCFSHLRPMDPGDVSR